MKHRIRGVRWLVVAALLVSIFTVPSALAQGPQGQAETLGTGLWFVELAGKPVAAGGSLATNTAEKVAFRAEARSAKVSFTERRAFNTLWNGLSIRTGADAATLAASRA